MIVNHKHKFIFIRSEKTASTSLERYLHDHCKFSKDDIITFVPSGKRKAQNIGGGLSEDDPTAFWNHMPGYIIRDLIPYEWDNYYKWCVDRHPLEKTISSYFHKLDLKWVKNFDDYMSGSRYFPAARATMGHPEQACNYPKYTEPTNPDIIIVDRVIKYENLNRELADVFKMLGIPWRGSLGYTDKNKYRKDKRPATEIFKKDPFNKHLPKLREVFAQECKLLGYKF